MLQFLSIALLSTPILSTPLAVKSGDTSTYAGCLASASTPTNLKTAILASQTKDACESHCLKEGYNYAFYNDDLCGCRTTGLDAVDFAPALDSEMNCKGSDWTVGISQSMFGPPTCYSSYKPHKQSRSTSNSIQVKDHESCFRYCLNYAAAVLVPNSKENSYTCTCDSIESETPKEYKPYDGVKCDKDTLIRYVSIDQNRASGNVIGGNAGWMGEGLPKEHDQDMMDIVEEIEEEEMESDQVVLSAVPTLKVDDKVKEVKDGKDGRSRAQSTTKLCPGRMKACRVPGRGLDDAFECIDVEEDILSCGGCMYGEIGVMGYAKQIVTDCTKMLGVRLDSVTCEHGQCAVTACESGFKLVGRSCVGIKSPSSSTNTEKDKQLGNSRFWKRDGGRKAAQAAGFPPGYTPPSVVPS